MVQWGKVAKLVCDLLRFWRIVMIIYIIISKLNFLVLAELGQDSIRVSAKECKDSAALDNSAENRWVGHTCSPLRLCLDFHVHYTVTSHVILTAGGLYFVN